MEHPGDEVQRHSRRVGLHTLYDFADIHWQLVQAASFEGATSLPDINASAHPFPQRVPAHCLPRMLGRQRTHLPDGPDQRRSRLRRRHQGDGRGFAEQLRLHLHTEPGDYEIAFVAANANVYGRKEVIRKVSVRIIEDEVRHHAAAARRVEPIKRQDHDEPHNLFTIIAASLFLAACSQDDTMPRETLPAKSKRCSSPQAERRRPAPRSGPTTTGRSPSPGPRPTKWASTAATTAARATTMPTQPPPTRATPHAARSRHRTPTNFHVDENRRPELLRLLSLCQNHGSHAESRSPSLLAPGPANPVGGELPGPYRPLRADDGRTGGHPCGKPWAKERSCSISPMSSRSSNCASK